jgi:hypothetical protein
LTQSIEVTAGQTAAVEFIYTGSEKPNPQS